MSTRLPTMVHSSEASMGHAATWRPSSRQELISTRLPTMVAQLLILASGKGHGAIVEALLQAGADVDKADINDYTALMMASLKGHGAIVEALLQAGADIDKATNDGATALIAASQEGHTAIVKALKRQGQRSDCGPLCTCITHLFFRRHVFERPHMIHLHFLWREPRSSNPE